MGLRAELDDHVPKYKLEASLIGTNPGLGFRPLPERIEDGPLIKYVSSNASHIEYWSSRINKFLESYMDKTKLPNGGRDQVICDYNRSPPPPGKACAVDASNWGACKKSNNYDYMRSSPCVFIKLNRIFDWVPDYYNDPDKLPENMPSDLKTHIMRIEKSKLNTVWVSCNGETKQDQDNIGELEFFPRYQGFPGFYYPYVNTPEYLSPVVAVHFLRPKRNVTINVECKAWAKNIQYSSRRGEKVGAVHFELHIQE